MILFFSQIFSLQISTRESEIHSTSEKKSFLAFISAKIVIYFFFLAIFTFWKCKKLFKRRRNTYRHVIVESIGAVATAGFRKAAKYLWEFFSIGNSATFEWMVGSSVDVSRKNIKIKAFLGNRRPKYKKK
jgi:hypothetical protein